MAGWARLLRKPSFPPSWSLSRSQCRWTPLCTAPPARVPVRGADPLDASTCPRDRHDHPTLPPRPQFRWYTPARSGRIRPARRLARRKSLSGQLPQMYASGRMDVCSFDFGPGQVPARHGQRPSPGIRPHRRTITSRFYWLNSPDSDGSEPTRSPRTRGSIWQRCARWRGPGTPRRSSACGSRAARVAWGVPPGRCSPAYPAPGLASAGPTTRAAVHPIQRVLARPDVPQVGRPVHGLEADLEVAADQADRGIAAQGRYTASAGCHGRYGRGGAPANTPADPPPAGPVPSRPWRGSPAPASSRRPRHRPGTRRPAGSRRSWRRGRPGNADRRRCPPPGSGTTPRPG